MEQLRDIRDYVEAWIVKHPRAAWVIPVAIAGSIIVIKAMF